MNAKDFLDLDDVYGALNEDNFWDILEEYLDNMEVSRKSAKEIMAAMIQWEDYHLYDKVLQDLSQFLTDKEKSKIINDYRKLFPDNYIPDV